MLQISELFVYPVKSLKGIKLSSALVTDRGFKYDRRWMLIDEQNRFITQRQIPQLALFRISITERGLEVDHTVFNSSIIIPFETELGEDLMVQVWSDKCRARLVSPEVNGWFSEMLSFPCRLVYMPETSKRYVDARYSIINKVSSS